MERSASSNECSVNVSSRPLSQPEGRGHCGPWGSSEASCSGLEEARAHLGRPPVPRCLGPVPAQGCQPAYMGPGAHGPSHLSAPLAPRVARGGRRHVLGSVVWVVGLDHHGPPPCPPLQPSLTVHPWMSCLMFQCLLFLICKMGLITVPTSRGHGVPRLVLSRYQQSQF